jgi:hypothetical protein
LTHPMLIKLSSSVADLTWISCNGERDRPGRGVGRLSPHSPVSTIGRPSKDVFGGTPNTARETPALPIHYFFIHSSHGYSTKNID